CSASLLAGATYMPRGYRRRGEPSGTLRALAAAVAQEPLDVVDELVARRQPLLVDHRLEPLDVGARRVVGGGREIEPRPKLAGLRFERAGRHVGAEVAAQRAQQLE